MGEQFYLIRTENAGVFFGHLKERNGNEAVLTDVRRIWYWKGATELLQMSQEGVAEPRACKFTISVPEITVLGVIEILPCSEAAVRSIQGVAEWRV